MAYREYLSSPSMLSYVDSFTTRTQYVRVVVLNWQGLPIANIEGRAQGGNVSISNNSPIRRTGSLTLVTELNPQATDLEIMHEVTNIKTLISVNKRIEIEIGIQNEGNQYLDYDIFWFPLGEYCLSNASVSWNNTGITVSLKLNDNMAFLNGEVGGTIPASTDLSKTAVGKPAPVYDIIYALAQMGGIPPSKIIIEDVPQQIAGIVKLTEDKEFVIGETKYSREKGDVIGTTLTDFYWPNESLSVSAGSTIAQALETIKQKLGNFEYFFDVNGAFHFRKIKNYLEEGSALQGLTKAINEKYFINAARGKSTYSFLESNLITAYTNNPQYNEIKNDFHVWGETPDTKLPLHYHLIIDDTIPNKYEKKWWTVTRDSENHINRATSYETKEEAERNGSIEYVLEVESFEIDDNLIISAVVISETEELEVPALEILDNRFYFEEENSDNWRMKMYLEALGEKNPTLFQSELIDNLPNMMDVSSTKYLPKTDTLYFLDAINTNDAALMNNVPVKGFAISAIGDRVKVINDSKINCLFENIKTDAWIGENLNLENLGDSVSIGIVSNPAYDALRSSIHEHLSYNNNITLTCIPIYHLDVNQRISVQNKESNINGDYIIQSISIPLALNGTMTINARKAIEMI